MEGARGDTSPRGLKRVRDGDEGEDDEERGQGSANAPAPTSPPDLPRRVRKKARKALEKRQSATVDQGMYQKVFGADAKPTIELKVSGSAAKSDLKVRDVQALVLWCLTDNTVNPKWAHIKHKALIPRVTAIFVDSLSADLLDRVLQSSPSLLPACLSAPVPQRGAGARSRVLAGLPIFLEVPVPSKELPAEPRPSQKLPIDEYLLAKDELEEHSYPSCAANPDYRVTKDAPHEARKLVGLDCEMVRTATGLELARVTLVEESGDVLLDMLVRPSSVVTDYLTAYSGMSSSILAPVQTTLAEAQERVCAFVSSATILVGHSLENDLHALRLVHGRVADTAVLFAGAEGRKQSLKHLASVHLNLAIQNGAHDSAEDARTALRLLQLKVEKGPDYGRPKERSQSLFAVLESATPPRKSALAATVGICQRFSGKSGVDVRIGADDSAVTEHAVGLVTAERHAFTFVHLNGVSLHLRNAEPKPDESREGSAVEVAQATLQHVRRIVESCAPRTLVLVLSGHGDIHLVKRLDDARCRARRTGSLTVWLPEQEKAFDAAVENARKAFTLVGITE